MPSIIITLPKKIKWEEYIHELDQAEKGAIMNFKVNNFPSVVKGDKCYLIHNGYIKGYMLIHGLSEKDFTCTTTGNKWSGKFIERTGKFYYLDNPIPMTGFQGFRYFK